MTFHATIYDVIHAFLTLPEVKNVVRNLSIIAMVRKRCSINKYIYLSLYIPLHKLYNGITNWILSLYLTGENTINEKKGNLDYSLH